jgi:hypothetical protein
LPNPHDFAWPGGAMLGGKPALAPLIRDWIERRIDALTTPNACVGGDECR